MTTREERDRLVTDAIGDAALLYRLAVAEHEDAYGQYLLTHAAATIACVLETVTRLPGKSEGTAHDLKVRTMELVEALRQQMRAGTVQ